MHLPTFAGSRIAPPYFHNAPTLRSLGFWRGLHWIVAPMDADGNTVSGAFRRCGRELVKGSSNTLAGGVVLRGERNGVSLHSVAAGLTFGAASSALPTAVPFSCFAFLVNRGGTGIQSLINASGVTGGGWTFQLSYGAGQLGITRWGIADSPTVALGAVPTGGAVSCVGLAMDGTNARFFLNGRFENVAAASVNAPTGGQFRNVFHRNGLTPTDNCALHIAYVWSRVVRDNEFMELMQDPWAIVRPPELSWSPLVAAAGSSQRTWFY